MKQNVKIKRNAYFFILVLFGLSNSDNHRVTKQNNQHGYKSQRRTFSGKQLGQ